MRSTPRRILIIKPSSFGDIVQSLPVLAALKRTWPDAGVDWAVKPEWAELIDGHPLLHRVILFPRNFSEALRCASRSRRERYRLVIDLQGLLRSGLYALMSGCPTRAGFADGREGSSWCYTERVKVSPTVVHAVDRYLDLVRQLGAMPDKTVTFPLAESSKERDWAESLRQREGIGASERVCVIHPTARWETKRWPTERFARLADRLIIEQGLRVVLIGGPAQLRQVDDVERQMKERALNLGGSTTLLQLAALLRRTNLLITNDSGPMHLAAAVGTPVVAVFGPTDPSRVGPYGAGHIVLRKTVDCSRCSRRRCVRDALCMKAIEVDEVLDAVRKITSFASLRERTTSTRPAEL